MKTMREKFEEDYVAVEEPCNNRQGFRIRYDYVGPWYRWKLLPEALRGEKRVIGNACAISLLLYLFGALQSSVLNYSRYVELFGMLSLAAFVFEAVGTMQFCTSKDKVTNMSFSDINTKLRVAPLLQGILILCAAAACVVVLVQERLLARTELAIVACYAGSGIASLYLFYRYRKLPYWIDHRMEEFEKKEGQKAEAVKGST